MSNPAASGSNRVLALDDRTTSLVLGVVSMLYLAATVNVGLNGNHIWRQADAYAQTLGFLHFKGLQPWQTFNNGIQVFDMPVYQFLVAEIARFTGGDPLVVARVVNLPVWGLFLLSAYLIADRLHRRSGVFAVFLCATSPLFLHYFSAPFPDAAVLTMCLGAVALLQRVGRRRSTVVAAAGLLALAAFIKSPLPYVVLVSLIVAALLRPRSERWAALRGLGLPTAASIIGAAAAEVIRKSVYDSVGPVFYDQFQWYFGTLDQRLSVPFWQTMAARLNDSMPTGWLAVPVAAAVVVCLLKAPRRALRDFAPSAVAFAAGWLVFSNIFMIHDYYELGVTALVFLSAAVALQRAGEIVQERLRALRSDAGPAPAPGGDRSVDTHAQPVKAGGLA